MASVLRVVTIAKWPKNAVLEGDEAVWKGRDGKTKRAELTDDRTRCKKIGGWQGRYTDGTGKRCNTRMFTTKNLAMMEAIRLEESKGAKQQATTKSDVSSLVANYLQSLAVIAGPRHVEQARTVLHEYLQKFKPTRLAAVDIDQITRWINERYRAGWVTAKKVKKTYSVRTRNIWVMKFKSFGAWIKQNLKLKYNPFEEIPLMNEDKADKKIERRSLTLDEFDRLIQTTACSEKFVYGMTGWQRSVLYILAGYTGLRVKSIAQLTPESFCIVNGIAVSVHSRSKNQKTGNLLTVPFPESIGREMALYVATRDPGKPLFHDNHWWATKGARILRHDLDAAGIPFIDASGLRFDFHAFRYFLCLLCIKAGKGNQVAQKLLDHSSPNLTANIYTKLGVSQMAEEVQNLPTMSFGTKFGTASAETAKNRMIQKDIEDRKKRRKRRLNKTKTP